MDVRLRGFHFSVAGGTGDRRIRRQARSEAPTHSAKQGAAHYAIRKRPTVARPIRRRRRYSRSSTRARSAHDYRHLERLPLRFEQNIPNKLISTLFYLIISSPRAFSMLAHLYNYTICISSSRIVKEGSRTSFISNYAESAVNCR